MRDVLTICREHGQAPSWWDTLDTEDQALLRADLIVRREPKQGGRRK